MKPAKDSAKVSRKRRTEAPWETWGGRKGDVARAMFYMAIRYEGGSHGITGHSEPDLELTDVDAERYQEMYDLRAADMKDRQEIRKHYFADQI